MTHFIKPEYLVSLYLILYDKSIVTLKELANYCGKLNGELKERNIEAVFLFSDKYFDEMLEEYGDYFLNGTYLIYDAIKRIVPNEVLSEKFTSYLSNDVLKVAMDISDKDNRRMITEEKIEVMKSYTEGKTVQSKAVIGDKWQDDSNPCWDWNHFEYRIKPELEYRPYESNVELFNDYFVKKGKEEIEHIFGGLWLKNKENGVEYLVNALNVNGDVDSCDIMIGDFWCTFERAFEKFVYLNDTPFGKKV